MIFAALGALTLAVVAAVAVGIGGKLYAPVPVYCGTWSGALALYVLTANSFTPLHELEPTTVLFFVTGALVFCAGAVAASWRTQAPVDLADRSMLRGSVALIIGLLFVVTVPAIFMRVSTLLAGVPLDQVLFLARNVDVDPSRLGISSLLGPFSNAIPLSIAITLLLYAVPVSPRVQWMRGLIFVATLGIQVSTGGRSGIVSLLIGMTCIFAMRGELTWRRMTLFGTVFLLLFFAIGLLVRKGGASLDASLAENVRLALQGLRDYAVGGLVAFQRVLHYPGEVPSTGGITRTAAIMLNGIGTHFPVASQHLEFSAIGDRLVANVYTSYFYYVEYGMAAAAGLVFLAGFTIAIVYARASQGSGLARALYATLAAGMVLSVFGEGFYNNVNYLGKLLICGVLLLKPIQPHRPHDRDEGVGP